MTERQQQIMEIGKGMMEAHIYGTASGIDEKL